MYKVTIEKIPSSNNIDKKVAIDGLEAIRRQICYHLNGPSLNCLVRSSGWDGTNRDIESFHYLNGAIIEVEIKDES